MVSDSGVASVGVTVVTEGHRRRRKIRRRATGPISDGGSCDQDGQSEAREKVGVGSHAGSNGIVFLALIPVPIEVDAVGMSCGFSAGVLGGDVDEAPAVTTWKDLHQITKYRLASDCISKQYFNKR